MLRVTSLAPNLKNIIQATLSSNMPYQLIIPKLMAKLCFLKPIVINISRLLYLLK